jgi:hypothetical protein
MYNNLATTHVNMRLEMHQPLNLFIFLTFFNHILTRVKSHKNDFPKYLCFYLHLLEVIFCAFTNLFSQFCK